MFGKNNMQEMMAKLQEMQGAVSESKKRLENIYVKGETEDGNVRFVLDGNRKLKEINIKDDAFNGDKDELIDDLITAFNKAIDDADHVNENEMRNTAFNMFPGMGG
jgi:DNA-binding YbaB/EbfC family protein|tara:strand:+ start:346 stop:663 length:318 start_codon:yes stop_codon:yes gene_type:complete